MPSGTPRYFKKLLSYEDRVTPDDTEFESRVRAHLGTGLQGLYNKDVAAGVALPTDAFTLLGFNSKDANDARLRLQQQLKEAQAKKDTAGITALQEKLNNFMGDKRERLNFPELAGLQEQGKHVFGVGAAASPRVYAHEFRHDKIEGEHANRIYDVLNSTSYPEYVNNLVSLYSNSGNDDRLRRSASIALLSEGDTKDYSSLPLGKMEEELLPSINWNTNSVIPGVYDKDAPYVNAEDHAALNRGTYNYGVIHKGFNKLLGKNLEGYDPDLGGSLTQPQDIPKSFLEERNYYPGLNFIGRAKAYEDQATAQKKATGGSIESANPKAGRKRDI